MRRTSDLGGIAAMLAATAVFVVGDSFMKLVTEDLPPFQVLFLRSVAASLACAVMVALRGEWRAISGALDIRALLRAAGETLCTLCYVVALARMPIADVVAILQTGSLIMVLGAAFLLRERIGPPRVALALAGFLGALMVAQPGGDARLALATSVDFVTLGRALIIEPEWVQKVAAGSGSTIRTTLEPDDREALTMPQPFWSTVWNAPGWFPGVA